MLSSVMLILFAKLLSSLMRTLILFQSLRDSTWNNDKCLSCHWEKLKLFILGPLLLQKSSCNWWTWSFALVKIQTLKLILQILPITRNSLTHVLSTAISLQVSIKLMEMFASILLSILSLSDLPDTHSLLILNKKLLFT